MAMWISNSVTPLNDVAKDFTREHVLDDEGNFCFGKLVPVPDIITKTRSPMHIVSPEELQAFKAKHQQATHCEFEQEGLLYTLDEDGEVDDAVCTEACSEDLIEKYGADNWYEYRCQAWGCKNEIGDCEFYENKDEEVYDFSTAWDPPWGFMLTLTAACPEGKWKWLCGSEREDWLVIELYHGEVIITEHGMAEDWEFCNDGKEFDVNNELYWNDRGEVPSLNDMENDTQLGLGVFRVKLHHKVVLDD